MKGIIFAGDLNTGYKIYSTMPCMSLASMANRYTEIGKGLYGPKKLQRLTSVFKKAAGIDCSKIIALV